MMVAECLPAPVSSNSLLAVCLKPLPKNIIVITAAIPMTIPMIVKMLRRLFFIMDLKETAMIFDKLFMSSPLLPEYDHREYG